MNKGTGSRWIEIGLLLTLCLLTTMLFILRSRQVAGVFGGIPLDDSYIHYRYAKNLALGRGFCYNPGEPSPGETSPLWAILLATLAPLTRNIVLTSQILGVLFHLFTAATMVAISRSLGFPRTWALWSGILVALLGRMSWAALSGMEVSLFALLIAVAVWLHLRSETGWLSWIGSYLLLGLATNVRPEGYLLYVLFLLDDGIQIVIGRRWRRAIGLAVCCLVYLSLVLPYILFCYRTIGRPFPASYYAKVILRTYRAGGGLTAPLSGLSPVVRYLKKIGSLWFYEDHRVLGLLAVVGLIAWLRKVIWSPGRLAVLFFPLFAGIASVGLSMPHHARYYLPLAPFLVMLGVGGILWVNGHLRKQWPRLGWIANLLLVLALLDGLWGVWRMSGWYAYEVDNLEKIHVSTARWINGHLPQGAILVTHDVGALVYLTDRRVIDPVGLVTPEIWRYFEQPDRYGPGQIDVIYQFLKERRPDYFVIAPNIYPQIASAGFLEPIHWAVSPKVVAVGDSLIVYRAHWEKAP